MGHSRLKIVHFGAAQVGEGDVLAGRRADHVGPRDEHVRIVAGHDDEVGEGRAVHGAAGARAEDDGDLRDHAGSFAGLLEDAAVLGKGEHSLLDSGAAGVEHRDDGNAQLEGLVHKGGDLVALDFAERAALDREVLSVDGHRLSGNRADSRHDPRAGEAFGHVAPAEAPDFSEASLVQEFGYAFAGRFLADGMLARLCLFLG